MTYKQILEEFDEKYPQLLRKRLYEELDLSGKITIECSSEVKSFLKQSFIKYLQGEVERLGSKKRRDEDYPHSEESNCGDCEWNRGNDFGYNQAISDQITHITNQIKELNENTK